jgi:hypothetical protein
MMYLSDELKNHFIRNGWSVHSSDSHRKPQWMTFSKRVHGRAINASIALGNRFLRCGEIYQGFSKPWKMNLFGGTTDPLKNYTWTLEETLTIAILKNEFDKFRDIEGIADDSKLG